MANKPKNVSALISFGFFMSLGIGFVFASLSTYMIYGFEPKALSEGDIFAYWYEMPFLLGYTSVAFLHGSKVYAATVLVTMSLILAIIYLPSRRMPHGTARWANFSDMVQRGYIKNYKKISGPIFGKTTSPKKNGMYVTDHDMPHSLVVAPTRAGKGVGVVIPTLLTYDGSILALDVKGELFEETSRARVAKGQKVFKFSPLDDTGRTHCYNPVDDIVRVPPERRFIEARRVAANLIVAKGKSAEGFIDGARDLFVAGLLYCIEKGNPTIGAVYDLLATPGEKYKLFAHLASQSEVPEVKRIFNNMAGNDTKIITSYTSVLGDGGLNLWADQLIKTATSKSDFSVYDLRRDPTSIFLCVSPNDLEVIAPLIRLIFQQLVSILQRTMPAKDEIHNVLFLLDEFKHLGKLEAIATAITTIAGYRGRFMFIIQSLSALTGAYEQHGKENFLSNTGIQVFMATADDETPQYISKAIGDQTHRQVNRSRTMGQILKDNVQSSSAGAPLIRPEQIRLLDEDTQIVLIKGQPPLKMPKVKYYADRILKKLYNAQKGPLPDAPVQVFDPGVDVSPLAEKAAADAAPPIETQTPQPPAKAEPPPVTMQVAVPAGLSSANGMPNGFGDTHNGQAIKVTSPQDQAKQADAAKVRDAEAEMEQQKALLERIIALQEKATGKSSNMR